MPFNPHLLDGRDYCRRISQFEDSAHLPFWAVYLKGTYQHIAVLDDFGWLQPINPSTFYYLRSDKDAI